MDLDKLNDKNFISELVKGVRDIDKDDNGNDHIWTWEEKPIKSIKEFLDKNVECWNVSKEGQEYIDGFVDELKEWYWAIHNGTITDNSIKYKLTWEEKLKIKRELFSRYHKTYDLHRYTLNNHPEEVDEAKRLKTETEKIRLQYFSFSVLEKEERLKFKEILKKYNFTSIECDTNKENLLTLVFTSFEPKDTKKFTLCQNGISSYSILSGEDWIDDVIDPGFKKDVYKILQSDFPSNFPLPNNDFNPSI